jgi:hypothetical protein
MLGRTHHGAAADRKQKWKSSIQQLLGQRLVCCIQTQHAGSFSSARRSSISASTSHLSSQSGASRRRGAVQRRSQSDGSKSSALGYEKQKVRLEFALQ